MPFCTQCGTEVGTADSFCARCGARQHAAPRVSNSSDDPLKNVSPRTVSVLCYVPFVGWIASIVVLASLRFRSNPAVRFHAFQGIYLFVTWLIVDWALAPVLIHMPSPGHTLAVLAGLLRGAVVFAWVWMIMKTSQDVLFRLPILGEMADRSVIEQR